MNYYVPIYSQMQFCSTQAQNPISIPAFPAQNFQNMNPNIANFVPQQNLQNFQSIQNLKMNPIQSPTNVQPMSNINPMNMQNVQTPNTLSTSVPSSTQGNSQNNQINQNFSSPQEFYPSQQSKTIINLNQSEEENSTFEEEQEEEEEEKISSFESTPSPVTFSPLPLSSFPNQENDDIGENDDSFGQVLGPQDDTEEEEGFTSVLGSQESESNLREQLNNKSPHTLFENREDDNDFHPLVSSKNKENEPDQSKPFMLLEFSPKPIPGVKYGRTVAENKMRREGMPRFWIGYS